jgi:hypothetical protein
MFTTLVATASVVAGAACNDSPSGPTAAPPTAYTPRPSLVVTLNGFVRVGGRSGGTGIVLNASNGDEIPLTGREAGLLENFDGAEVEVRGTWDAEGPALVVSDFLVRAVGGVAAMDGVLTKIYADEIEEEFLGYGLRLTRSVLLVPLVDPPSDLLEHVGDRVWVTSGSHGETTAYGIIGRTPERY